MSFKDQAVAILERGGNLVCEVAHTFPLNQQARENSVACCLGTALLCSPRTRCKSVVVFAPSGGVQTGSSGCHGGQSDDWILAQRSDGFQDHGAGAQRA